MTFVEDMKTISSTQLVLGALQMLRLWFCAQALQILRRGLCARFSKILRLRVRARALQIPLPIILPLAFRPVFAKPTTSAAR